MAARLLSSLASFALVDEPRRGDGVHVALLSDTSVVVVPRSGLLPGTAASAAPGAAWSPAWLQDSAGDGGGAVMEGGQSDQSIAARLAAGKLACSSSGAGAASSLAAAQKEVARSGSAFVTTLRASIDTLKSRGKRETVPDAVLSASWSPPQVLPSGAPLLAVQTAHGRVALIGPRKCHTGNNNDDSTMPPTASGRGFDASRTWTAHPVQCDSAAEARDCLRLPAAATCCAWAGGKVEASVVSTDGKSSSNKLGSSCALLAVGTPAAVIVYGVAPLAGDGDDADTLRVKVLARVAVTSTGGQTSSSSSIAAGPVCSQRTPSAVTWLDEGEPGSGGSSGAHGGSCHLAVGFSDGSIDVFTLAVRNKMQPGSRVEEDEEGAAGSSSSSSRFRVVAVSSLTPHLRPAPSAAGEEDEVVSSSSGSTAAEYLGDAAVTRLVWDAPSRALAVSKGVGLWVHFLDAGGAEGEGAPLQLQDGGADAARARLVEDATSNIPAVMRPRWSVCSLVDPSAAGARPRATGVRNAHDSPITGLVFWSASVSSTILIGGFHRTATAAGLAGVAQARHLVSCGMDGKVRAWSLEQLAAPASAGMGRLCRELYAGSSPSTATDMAPRPLVPLTGMCLSVAQAHLYAVGLRVRPVLFHTSFIPRDADAEVITIPLVPVPQLDVLVTDAWVPVVRAGALALPLLRQQALERLAAKQAGAAGQDDEAGVPERVASPSSRPHVQAAVTLDAAQEAALASLVNRPELPPALRPAAAGGAGALVAPSGREDGHAKFLVRHRAALLHSIEACIKAGFAGSAGLRSGAPIVAALAIDRATPLCALDELCPLVLQTGATAVATERTFIGQTVTACLRAAGGKAAVAQRILDGVLESQRIWRLNQAPEVTFWPGGDSHEPAVEDEQRVPGSGRWWSLFAAIPHAIALLNSGDASSAQHAVLQCLSPFTKEIQAQNLSSKPLFATLQSTFPVLLAGALQTYAENMSTLASSAPSSGADPLAPGLLRLRALQVCVRLCDEVLRAQLVSTSPDLTAAAAEEAKTGAQLPLSKEDSKKHHVVARPLRLSSAARQEASLAAGSAWATAAPEPGSDGEGAAMESNRSSASSSLTSVPCKPPHKLTLGDMRYYAMNSSEAAALPPKWVWLAAAAGPTLARWAVAEFALLTLSALSLRLDPAHANAGSAELHSDDLAALKMIMPWVPKARLPPWLQLPLTAVLATVDRALRVRGLAFTAGAACGACGCPPAASTEQQATAASRAASQIAALQLELQYQDWWGAQTAALTVPPREALPLLRHALRFPSPDGASLGAAMQCTRGHLMNSCGASLALLGDTSQELSGFGITGTWGRVRSACFALPPQLPAPPAAAAAGERPAKRARLSASSDN